MNRPATSRSPIVPLRAPARVLAWAAVLIGALSVIPAPPTWAADGPVISGPEKSPAFKQVRLSLQGDADDVDWVVFPIGKADGERFGDKGASYTFTGPPGEYQVLVTLVKANKLSHATKVVVIGEPGPGPVPPGPTPGPTPNPTPGPTPTPTPTPSPVPIPTPGPSPNPGPVPGFDAPLNGRAYAKELTYSFADSLGQASTETLDGKPMEQVKANHVARWKATREAAFDRRFVGALDTLIPPGNDNPTIEQRRRYADFLQKVADGMKQGVTP
jgi:hypothetical protein